MQVRITTIRARLLIGFVLMAALSAIFISAGSIVVGYYNGQDQTRNRLDSVALSKELQISAWTAGLQNELTAILTEEYAADRATIVLFLAREHEYYSMLNGPVRERLRFFVSQSPEIEELFLVDLDGHVVLSTDAERERMDTGDQLFFQQGLKGPFAQLPFGSGNFSVLSDSEAAIFIAKPVLTAAGQTFGILVGRVGPEPLRQILADQTGGLSDGGKSYLVDQMHMLITASNLVAARSDHLVGQSEGIDSILATKTQHSGSYIDYRGIQVMGVSRWMTELQAALFVEQDQSAVFRSVFTSLGVNLGITLLIVLLAAAISSYISKSIATPLVDLADTATQIAAGDLTRRTMVLREDEVGVVARAFNSMTHQLRDLISSLEQRVTERTQTLQRRALQLETSAQVSQEITSILEIDALLTQVAQLIQEAFGYSHVHVFLVDRDGHKPDFNPQLLLRASSGETSLQLQRLEIGPDSLNGHVAQSNQAVLVNDVTQEPRYLADGLLPETRSELVIPLRVGQQVIGTLDVHSDQRDAFTPQDVLVLQSLGDQIAIAIENARLYRRSRALAVLEERNRLARELHDSVTQSLYGLVVYAGAGRQVIESGEADLAKGHLARIEQAAQQALKEMRLLVYELRPPALEEDGLVGALRQRLEAVEGRTGVTVDLQVHGVVDLPAQVEEGLFRIAHEALNNVLKHAAAASVTVQIQVDDRGIELTVVDDGVGFDDAGDTGGLGLTSMSERAQGLDATLTIQSGPGEGTKVNVRKPK